jgi:hypothetical protein
MVRRGLLVVAFALVLGARAVLAADTKTVTIFEARQFSVPVPWGWSFDESEDPNLGTPTLKLGDPGKKVALQMTFIPDPSNKLSSREAVEAEAKRILKPYVDTSVEKEIRLTAFDSPDGRGAYAAFTDAKLDPKHIPEDEWLIGVSGIRTWKGGYTVFTLLTNTKDSSAYRTALEIAISGTRQVKAPVAF